MPPWASKLHAPPATIPIDITARARAVRFHSAQRARGTRMPHSLSHTLTHRSSPHPSGHFLCRTRLSTLSVTHTRSHTTHSSPHPPDSHEPHTVRGEHAVAPAALRVYTHRRVVVGPLGARAAVAPHADRRHRRRSTRGHSVSAWVDAHVLVRALRGGAA